MRIKTLSNPKNKFAQCNHPTPASNKQKSDYSKKNHKKTIIENKIYKIQKAHYMGYNQYIKKNQQNNLK